jgi:hypothetical protein
MKRILLMVIACSLGLTACGNIEGGSLVDNQQTPAVTVPTATEESTSLPTQVSLATATAPFVVSAKPTDIPEIPVETKGPQLVKIFLIALEDNGKAGPLVGCGDSVVSAQVAIEPTKAVLRAALEALLANKSRNFGESGLYNALYEADLKVDRAVIEDGVAHVDLSGSMMLRGECDDPRVQAQLEQTVLQFSTIQKAEITLNGKPLAEALSLK